MAANVLREHWRTKQTNPRTDSVTRRSGQRLLGKNREVESHTERVHHRDGARCTRAGQSSGGRNQSREVARSVARAASGGEGFFFHGWRLKKRRVLAVQRARGRY